MIFPLAPCALKGAIWYQGESNAGRAWQYRELLTAMIRSWRGLWADGDPMTPAPDGFPFLIVQLANFQAPAAEPGPSAWAELQEAQAWVAANEPRCGLAVALDLGAANDIHPKNKQDVGRRLAFAARAVAYGEQFVHSGPVYERMEKDGARLRLHFRHVGAGLEARGGGPLRHFAVAGADRKFVWANAGIDGDTVVVSAEGVPDPVAVRYAWAANPVGANLGNKDGLPAGLFRTDDWPLQTQDAR
jgi:sialate O-acetylesterase